MEGLTWLTERPIAHRGLHGNGLVENTLGAAAAAVAANYGIEVDLQLSADGEVMVFHDATLDRLTKSSGPLAAKSSAELKAVAFRDCAEHMPTLQELLDTVAGRTPLVLELKSKDGSNARLPARVAEILLRYAGPVAAMSFDPETVIALRKFAPGLPRGVVAERYYDHPDWKGLTAPQKFWLGNLLHIPRTNPHFIAYYVRDLPAIAPLFARYLLGVKLLTWTVRSESDRKRADWWANQMIFEGFRP
jgi:glycerophosphoryl diester phosphodiesterase